MFFFAAVENVESVKPPSRRELAAAISGRKKEPTTILQPATQSVIETSRPSMLSGQISRSLESKPGGGYPVHRLSWVHRFHKAHEDWPGCPNSAPPVLNCHPKFRSERCHYRNPMSPLRRTKDIRARCSCSRGEIHRTRRRTDPRSAARTRTSPQQPCSKPTLTW